MNIWIALAVIVVLLLIVPLIVGAKTGKLKLALPIALLLTGGALWLGWSSIGESPKWQTAEALKDKELQIAYVGDECEDHRSVSVDEGDDTITVTITTRSFASSCSDVGVKKVVTVELDDDIGAKTLIDGGCQGDEATCAVEIERVY